MLILHSGSLNVKSGGPALSTYLTLKGLMQSNIDVEIVMPPLTGNGKLIANDVSIHYTESIKNVRFGYMHGLSRTLEKLPLYDIYHIQGLWQYLGHGVATFAHKHQKPYLITLRGMMYPQAMAHSSLVKKVSLALYQRKDLQRAACIQATCIEEMEYYRELGFTNPVAVLPNPIETTDIIDRPVRQSNHLRFGYLGRVHPRKRIERLIYAFDTLRNELRDAELLIIGTDDKQYEEFFPSDFENFGNIVTEALVRGVPVIASKGMPWKELEDYHCGWWVDNDQESINRTIMKAYETSEIDRIQKGMNGKRLMREKYAVNILGLKMKQLYEWVLYGGTKPNFVYE